MVGRVEANHHEWLEEDYGQEVADYLNGLIGESSFVLPKWYKRTFTKEN